MATERDFELLDDYIANRLKGSARSDFERKMQSDPELQNEFSVQQSMVEGIKKARAVELKSMLQNVPLSTIPQSGTSIGVKTAIGAITAALIATGVYFYFQNDEPAAQPPVSEQVGQSPSKTEPAASSTDVSTEQTEAEPEVETNNESAKESIAAEATQPKLEVFDPTEEGEETVAAADESPRSSSDNTRAAIPVQIDKQHKEFTFHYQFRDDKLFLYGPFEKNLYEIMEFINADKTTMFLFYKTNYYLLKHEGDKITPLSPITDKALLGKLKEYRKN